MTERLEVVITSKDGVSKTFLAIADSAKKAGGDVEAAGKKGTQGLKELDQAADQASESVSSLGDTADRTSSSTQNFGAALAVIGGALTYAGNAAMDQERQLMAMDRAYGDASDTMQQFAEQMQRTTQFSNDAARESALVFSSLTREYGLSLEQVQQLMTVSADLASLYGISLVDASTRIQSAIRGEAEAAEYLGLTLNQQSIDRENLTLTMSNQEAAQFRLNALLQQSSYAQGAAGEMASKGAGQMRQWVNELQDGAQAIGGFIGPMGSLVGGLGLGVAGIGQMSGALGTLTAAGSKALPVLTAIAKNPLFLGLSAVAGGLALWTELSDRFSRADREAQALDESTKNLAQTLNDMQVVMGQMVGAQRFELAIQGMDKTFTDWQTKFQEGVDAINRTGQFEDMEEPSGWIWDMAIADAAANNSDNIVESANRIVEALDLTDVEQTDIQNAITALGPLFTNAAIDAQKLDAAIADLFAEFARTGDAQALIDGLTALNTNSADLLLTLNQLTAGMTATERAFAWMIDDMRMDGMGDLADDLERINELTIDLSGSTQLSADMQAQFAASQERLNKAVQDGRIDGDKYSAFLAGQMTLLHQGVITYEEYALSIILAADNLGQFAVETEAAGLKVGALAARTALARTNLELFAATLPDATAKMKLASEVIGAIDWGGVQKAKEHRDAWLLSIGDVRDAYQAMVEERQQQLLELAQSLAGLDNPLDQWNASSGATPYSQIAMDARDASTALDTLYRIVVGNTDAFASQADGIAKWAEELIGAVGQTAELDDAYARWIERGMDAAEAQERFNLAQGAATSIFESNARIQEHIVDIQLAQSPLIAESTAALEQQLGIIAGYEPALQLTALAWMDSATAAKALEIATMATAVANGELGASGEAAFTKYLTGLAQVDPAMKALLIDMGLVSEGADGTITVTLDGAEGAISEIERLTQAIVGLVDWLDDGEINGSFTIDAIDNATPTVEDIKSRLADLDGDQVTAFLEGDDSGIQAAIQAGWDALLGIDGESASVTIHGNDEASGVIDAVRFNLDAINGRSATTTIRTIYESIGVGPSPFAHGGMVQAFAHGGVASANMVPIWAGEAGPEVAHFATGGTAVLPHEGLYHVPAGTYVSPANASNTTNYGGAQVTVNITVEGNVTSETELFNRFGEEFARKVVNEVHRRNAAAGIRAF